MVHATAEWSHFNTLTQNRTKMVPIRLFNLLWCAFRAVWCLYLASFATILWCVWTGKTQRKFVNGLYCLLSSLTVSFKRYQNEITWTLWIAKRNDTQNRIETASVRLRPKLFMLMRNEIISTFRRVFSHTKWNENGVNSIGNWFNLLWYAVSTVWCLFLVFITFLWCVCTETRRREFVNELYCYQIVRFCSHAAAKCNRFNTWIVKNSRTKLN